MQPAARTLNLPTFVCRPSSLGSHDAHSSGGAATPATPDPEEPPLHHLLHYYCGAHAAPTRPVPTNPHLTTSSPSRRCVWSSGSLAAPAKPVPGEPSRPHLAPLLGHLPISLFPGKDHLRHRHRTRSGGTTTEARIQEEATISRPVLGYPGLLMPPPWTGVAARSRCGHLGRPPCWPENGVAFPEGSHVTQDVEEEGGVNLREIIVKEGRKFIYKIMKNGGS